MTDAVLGQIRRDLAPVHARLDALEQKGISYKGVFTPGETYAIGDLITFDGSMWICKIAGARGRPGTDPTGWQLCVKRGTDGKDLR